MNRIKRTIFAAGLLVVLAGCARIDFDYPRPESIARTNTADTYLGRQLTEYVASKPEDQSGFYPLEDGVEALAARLMLATRAERSIDIQYYLIKTDITSHAFIGALLRAADRGVRVRLLLDDVFTAGYDAGMAGLDSHPYICVVINRPAIKEDDQHVIQEIRSAIPITHSVAKLTNFTAYRHDVGIFGQQFN